MNMTRYLLALLLGGTATTAAFAHGIEGADQAFLLNNVGPQIGPYIYLGAKHMVTGYDHLAFLAGVIFFLYKMRDVVTYVTLFAVGHSADPAAGRTRGHTRQSVSHRRGDRLLRGLQGLREPGRIPALRLPAPT